MSTTENLAIPLDELIYGLAERVFPTGGFFLEAGANDGVRHSNTLGLDSELWKGILVEPSRAAFADLVVNRPESILENCALVGDDSVGFISGTFEEGSLMGSAHPTLRRRDPAVPGNFLARLTARGRSLLGIAPKLSLASVRAATLDAILRKHLVSKLDLLILDVEGLEIDILESFSFTPKPRIIVVETRKNDASAMSDILLRAGFVLAGNFSNFSKCLNPLFSGDHQDYVWVSKNEPNLIQAVANTEVFRHSGDATY